MRISVVLPAKNEADGLRQTLPALLAALAPIDPATVLGEGVDPLDHLTEIDAIVRQEMQDALDELARERRFPVLG